MSIEVILFGVLISVIVLDLIIKGRKKKSDVDSTLKKIEYLRNTKGVNKDIEEKSSFSFKEYLVERPKNITLYLLSVIILKILIHYTVYSETYFKKISNPERAKGGYEAVLRGVPRYKNIESDYPFSFYIKNLFSFDGNSPHIFMWIICIGLLSFITWQLNSYIQKR